MLQFYLSYFKKPYSCLLTESTQSLCVLESLDNLSMQVNHSQRLGDRPLKVWTLCKKDGVVQTAHCRLCSAQCRLHMPGCEAPCILLRRLAYPNRLCDLELFFGCHYLVISSITNILLEHIEGSFKHLLDDASELKWLTAPDLDELCEVSWHLSIANFYSVWTQLQYFNWNQVQYTFQACISQMVAYSAACIVCDSRGKRVSPPARVECSCHRIAAAHARSVHSPFMCTPPFPNVCHKTIRRINRRVLLVKAWLHYQRRSRKHETLRMLRICTLQSEKLHCEFFFSVCCAIPPEWVYARLHYFPIYEQCIYARCIDSDLKGTTHTHQPLKILCTTEIH